MVDQGLSPRPPNICNVVTIFKSYHIIRRKFILYTTANAYANKPLPHFIANTYIICQQSHHMLCHDYTITFAIFICQHKNVKGGEVQDLIPQCQIFHHRATSSNCSGIWNIIFLYQYGVDFYPQMGVPLFFCLKIKLNPYYCMVFNHIYVIYFGFGYYF